MNALLRPDGDRRGPAAVGEAGAPFELARILDFGPRLRITERCIRRRWRPLLPWWTPFRPPRPWRPDGPRGRGPIGLSCSRHDLGRAPLEVGRILVRSRLDARSTALTASSSEVTMKPVTPWSTISGTAPQRHATTGVPQAMASIMTRPNGSGQSMGNRTAAALPRNVDFSLSPISPRNSIPGSLSRGSITLAKWPGQPRRPSRRS